MVEYLLMSSLVLQSPKGLETFPRQGLVIAPPRPLIIITSSNAYTKMNLAWTSVSNASGYIVYQGIAPGIYTNQES